VSKHCASPLQAEVRLTYRDAGVYDPQRFGQ
jgi:hypothetical protein